MTRFGVILEAYLKGCGEAMLRQFEHQVEMQTTLEEIASVVSHQLYMAACFSGCTVMYDFEWTLKMICELSIISFQGSLEEFVRS